MGFAMSSPTPSAEPGEVTAGFVVRPVALPAVDNILTIDFENWNHISSVPEVRYLLDVLDRHDTKATFFVVGASAESMAATVREAHERGHEIATHGWTHAHVGSFTPEEFREEVHRSIETLSEMTGEPVVGFRAPLFSVVRRTEWALDVLIELGIRYDSSIFPIAGHRYGIPGFPLEAVHVVRAGGSIVEVPPSAVRVSGRALPVAGGGYFRALPYWAIGMAVRSVRRERRPFVAYVHPYEFRREHLRHDASEAIRQGRLHSRRDELRANFLRHSMPRKLECLLSDFRFTSMRRCLDGVS
jgi:polysaccharide deacetylase family protein (PEP-CTERM system associated)